MKKLYVLVRKDLQRSQQAVQAGHALAEYLLSGYNDWNNGTLVYLSVKNEESLVDWTKKLTVNNMKWVGFREPDMNDQLTAISTVSDGEIFKLEKLL